MNKLALKIFVGIVALSLAGCAAFFSIVGLSKLFAGAAVAVIVMASTLEASKLVIASFLYRFWATVNKTLRFYLLIAITIIALITSIGIYGFLSGAYQTTKSKYDLTQTQTDSLSTQKLYFEASANTFKTQLESKNIQLTNLTSIRNSQELRATQLVTSNRSSRSADRSAKETDASIKTLNKDIDELNKKVIAYSDSASKTQVSITQLGLKNEISSELGSLAYISRVLNVDMDSVVNILIILFIIVFDPLAICMVLAFNFMSKTPDDNKPKEESQKEELFTKEDYFTEPEEEYLPKENHIIYDPDFFLDIDPYNAYEMSDQPSEQPLAQPVQEPVITIPQPRDKEELKELKRREIDKARKVKTVKKNLNENLYNEDNSKTY
jgi:hypothetical protein